MGLFSCLRTEDCRKPQVMQGNLKHRENQKNSGILRNGGGKRKKLTAPDYLLEHLVSKSNNPFRVK